MRPVCNSGVVRLRCYPRRVVSHMVDWRYFPGGQTGFDTSGIRAGIRLGIDTIGYYPKGFKIRDLQGDKIQTKEDVYKQFIS